MVEFKKMRKDLGIIFVFIAIFTVYLCFRTFSYPYPNGRDAWFHILVARQYYKGENGMISQLVMNSNLVPYAPLYHLILAPFTSSLELALLAQQIFQCLFYPLSLLSLMLLTKKHEGYFTAILFGMLLVGTYFGYGMAQARPQTLAMTLFPLAFWACLENKKVSFVILATIMFYVYSPLTLALVFGLLVFKLKKKQFKQVLAIAVLVAPLLFFQAYHTLGSDVYDRWIRVGDTGIFKETQDFFFNPLYYLWTGLGVSIIGFVLMALNLFNYRKLSDFDKLMVLSFLGFLIAIPVWWQRAFHFIIVPFAFFTAKYVSKLDNLFKIGLFPLICWQVFIFSFWSFWMSPPPYLWAHW